MLLAANLSTMFQEHTFLKRFEAARQAGFTAVECQFPYAHPAEAIAERLRANDLQMVMFNTPRGDAARGELGFAALPGSETRLQETVHCAIAYCRVTGVRLLHVLAGRVRATPATREAFESALVWAAPRAAEHGIDLLIEPLCPADAPDYFLTSFDLAADIITKLGQPNIKLQFDVYHRQRTVGDVLAGLRTLLPIIGHVQIASVPGRHEPGSGELNDLRILNELETLGYRGAIGCEYFPAQSTVSGLDWLRKYLSDG